MATPLYDAFVAKVRDWSNRREVATVPTSIIEDCIKYGNDDIYRDLRIPQLETTVEFTVDATANANSKYTIFDVPEDLIEFIYLAVKDTNDTTKIATMYNQVNDVRTFLDPTAEQYNRYRYVWKDLSFLISPQLEVGDKVELHYYRRLPQFNALYSVIPANWSADYADDAQPLLTSVLVDGTALYKAGTGDNIAVFATMAEATAWQTTYGGGISTLLYEGKEAWNWLRDAHERLPINAALIHIGRYMRDKEMIEDAQNATTKIITDLNREDKYRKAKGGNVQMNVNTGGLI